MAELVTVRVRDCACPDKPHADGDEVYLRPTIGLEGGLAAESDTQRSLIEAMEAAGPILQTDAYNQRVAADAGELLRRKWLVTFTRFGAVGWNFLDEKGPIPFDVNVLLENYDLGRQVADKAADLYAETVNRPLVASVKKASRRSPTSARTRRPRTSTRKPRASSSPAASVGQQSVTSP